MIVYLTQYDMFVIFIHKILTTTTTRKKCHVNLQILKYEIKPYTCLFSCSLSFDLLSYRDRFARDHHYHHHHFTKYLIPSSSSWVISGPTPQLNNIFRKWNVLSLQKKYTAPTLSKGATEKYCMVGKNRWWYPKRRKCLTEIILCNVCVAISFLLPKQPDYPFGSFPRSENARFVHSTHPHSHHHKIFTYSVCFC